VKDGAHRHILSIRDAKAIQTLVKSCSLLSYLVSLYWLVSVRLNTLDAPVQD
jgi:hypothetical protein